MNHMNSRQGHSCQHLLLSNAGSELELVRRGSERHSLLHCQDACFDLLLGLAVKVGYDCDLELVEEVRDEANHFDCCQLCSIQLTFRELLANTAALAGTEGEEGVSRPVFLEEALGTVNFRVVPVVGFDQRSWMSTHDCGLKLACGKRCTYTLRDGR